MRGFKYARPTELSQAISILAEHGDRARLLAGGTDLIIRLRDGTFAPDVVVDIKRIPEMQPAIELGEREVRISAGTVMTQIHDSPVIGRWFPALAEAARYVGSVQIRNRATLAGNQCNASPAADTAPPLLVYDARLEIAGLSGTREVPLNEFFVRSGETGSAADEIVTAVVLPIPEQRMGSGFQRRTRRRGHDLASVTVAVSVDEQGSTRLCVRQPGPATAALCRGVGHGRLRGMVRARAPVRHLDAGEPRLPIGHAPRSDSPRRGNCSRAIGEGMIEIEIDLNGRTRAVSVEPHHTLLDALRDDLALTGTKECCLVGECGACTVRLNGEIVDSCLVLAAEADDGSVETIEGLAAGGRLTALQAAFLAKGAVQCGFCTPGQLMAADDLLRRAGTPSRAEIEEGLAGNYCRCHCYYQIFDAVEAAAAKGGAEPRVLADVDAAARNLPAHVVDQ